MFVFMFVLIPSHGLTVFKVFKHCSSCWTSAPTICIQNLSCTNLEVCPILAVSPCSLEETALKYPICKLRGFQNGAILNASIVQKVINREMTR